VARQGDRVAAFFCNGDPAGEASPGWFMGRAEPGGAAFQLARDGWSVDGILDEAGAHGLLVEPEGDVSAWSAAAPWDPQEGLYASFHDSCTTGVIVLDAAPASAPRVRGAWWCDEGDQPILQVTPLLPLTFDEGRIVVEIDLESGVRQLEVAILTDLPR
jgi:hypothetical protein